MKQTAKERLTLWFVAGQNALLWLNEAELIARVKGAERTQDAIEFLIDRLQKTKTNGEFFNSMNAPNA